MMRAPPLDRTCPGGVPAMVKPPIMRSGSKVGKRRCCSPRMKSHMVEWCLTVAVIVIPLACAYFLIPFRARSISLLDASIQQPYYPLDSLPILSVFIPSIAIPLLCFLLYPLLLSRCARRMGLPEHPYSFHYTYWWSSCMVQTVGLTVLLSELSKRLVQMPRPDFLNRCFPDGIPTAVMEKAKATNYIINTEICTPTSQAVYEDGLQSLPSEHTSLSWCMMAILILFFYTLRRELVAHSLRQSRASRVKKRNALVERLIAAGLDEANAIAMAASIKNEACGAAAGGEKDDSVMGTDELLPPFMLGEAKPEDIEEHRQRSSAGDGGAVTNGQAAAHAKSKAPAPLGGSATEAAELPAGTRADQYAPPAGITARDDRDVESASLEQQPGPGPAQPASVVSPYWPNSHVVFIAHVLAPFGWAVSVGLSRTFDHKHGFGDVLAGAVLGVCVAFAVFRMHLIKFQGYHRRWNEEGENEEMDLEAAREASQVRVKRLNQQMSSARAGQDGSQLNMSTSRRPQLRGPMPSVSPSVEYDKDRVDSRATGEPVMRTQMRHLHPYENSAIALTVPSSQQHSASSSFTRPDADHLQLPAPVRETAHTA